MYLILLLVICLRLSSLSNVCAIDQGLKLFLVEAAMEKNLDIVRWLVKKEAYINVKDDKGQTPLMHASTMDDSSDVIEVLLAEGADADLRDDESKTALHLASETGNKAAVELLVAHMKNTSFTDNRGRTALHLAVNSDNSDVLSYLLDYGLDYNAKDIYGFTPFHAAAMMGKTKMLQILKDKEIEIDSRTWNQTTPLMLATLFEQNKAAEYLVELGSNVDSQDNNNWTALHYAAYYGNLELVKLLVENHATIDVKNSDGMTPLHLAVDKGHYVLVEYLTDKGANMYTPDNNNNTLLHGAAASGNVEILKLLTEKIQQLDPLNGLGYTPLIEALIEGCQDTVKLLIDAGADTGLSKRVDQDILLKALSDNNTKLLISLKEIDNNFKFNFTNSKGMTLLHYASRSSNAETIKYLLDVMFEEFLNKTWSNTQPDQTLLIGTCLPCYANITNIRDNEGKTPLHHAAEWGNADTIYILLNHGANKIYADNHGLTAFHVAAKYGRTEILKILALYDTDINSVDNHAKSAVFLSTQEGKLESLQYLIGLGANLTVKDAKGWSLLHAATANRHNAVLQELLTHKNIAAEINDVDKDDKPASWYAMHLRYIDILEILELNGARIRQDHLCKAVENNNVEFVEYLTRKNSIQVVTTCFKNKMTLLHVAASKGHVNLVKRLTKYPCLVNSLDNDKKSSLWYAVNEQKWECAKEIKKAGGVIEPLVTPIDAVRNNLTAFVKYYVKQGFDFPKNSLHEAVSRCQIDIFTELVNISRLINTYDDQNKTALWYAIKGEHWYCVEVLKKAGGVIYPPVSPIDAVKNNLTAFVKYFVKEGFDFPNNSLHEAASRGYIDIVTELVNITRLINAYDDQNKIALWYAIKGEHWDCVDVLEKAEGEVKPNYEIVKAVKNNQLSYVKYLIRKGVSVNSTDSEGIPIVYRAAVHGYSDIVKYLLDSGADIKASHPVKLYSMVTIASSWGHCDIVRLLLSRGAPVNTIDIDMETALNASDPKCKQDLLNYGAKRYNELRG